ncbi:MAG: SocA family protein [Nitrospirae bacterium]|nr:SocA family protein [Nitrospirota bacterium]
METKTIIEAVHYLLDKLGTCDKIKLIKLIFFADKYHLTRYGRSITHDTYFAMPLGIVGSTLKDILSFNSNMLSKQEFKDVSDFIEKIDENNFKSKKNIEYSYDMLSETDIEALDFIINNFGNKTQWELSEYSHKYPEWLKYEDELTSGTSKRFKLKIEELMSVIENDALFIDNDHINESKRILRGI